MKLDWIETAQSEPRTPNEAKALVWRLKAWATLKIKRVLKR